MLSCACRPPPLAADEAPPVEQRSEDRELDRAARQDHARLTMSAAAMEQRNAATAPRSSTTPSLGLASNAFPLEIAGTGSSGHYRRGNCPQRRHRDGWIDCSQRDGGRDGSRRQLPRCRRPVHPRTPLPARAPSAASAWPVCRPPQTLAVGRLGRPKSSPRVTPFGPCFRRKTPIGFPAWRMLLRRDLGMALTEGVDRVVFKGDSSGSPNEAAGDITGLEGVSAVITELTITQANKIKGPETLEPASSGWWMASTPLGLSDLNIVATIGAWRLWEQHYPQLGCGQPDYRAIPSRGRPYVVALAWRS